MGKVLRVYGGNVRAPWSRPKKRARQRRTRDGQRTGWLRALLALILRGRKWRKGRQ